MGACEIAGARNVGDAALLDESENAAPEELGPAFSPRGEKERSTEAQKAAPAEHSVKADKVDLPCPSDPKSQASYHASNLALAITTYSKEYTIKIYRPAGSIAGVYLTRRLGLD